jgi:hypothetical protein
MAKGFILGFIVAIAAVVAAGYFFVTTGALPAGQDAKPRELEEWAAETSGDDSPRDSGAKVSY